MCLKFFVVQCWGENEVCGDKDRDEGNNTSRPRPAKQTQRRHCHSNFLGETSRCELLKNFTSKD